MRVQLESTTKMVEINSVPARVWEGVTEHGVECYACITRIASKAEQDQSEFARDLEACRPSSPEASEAFPARMVL